MLPNGYVNNQRAPCHRRFPSSTRKRRTPEPPRVPSHRASMVRKGHHLVQDFAGSTVVSEVRLVKTGLFLDLWWDRNLFWSYLLDSKSSHVFLWPFLTPWSQRKMSADPMPQWQWRSIGQHWLLYRQHAEEKALGNWPLIRIQGLLNVPWLGYIGHHLIVAIKKTIYT